MRTANLASKRSRLKMLRDMNPLRSLSKLIVHPLIHTCARFQLRTIYCFSCNASKNRRVPSQMGQILTVDLISRLALHRGHLTL
jgi:hypothetical protein